MKHENAKHHMLKHTNNNYYTLKTLSIGKQMPSHYKSKQHHILKTEHHLLKIL